ncbi:acyltransferase family protein [Actinokineospora xionganensis]|uniref:Acyltransferase n=1 Tax=Actinokineospora xionganensis TaxID=2684470 RepID=A0ABR7L8N9_9PSEU|nr:acyltransferase [Actinokineospora xionganensis]MBC6449042.1 acyltransferase [Actinokineospora xionganensis]
MGLGFFSVYPYVILIAALLFVLRAKVFGRLDEPVGQVERTRSVDGLRGFLAISVLFHHLAVWHGYATTNAWAEPPSAFYEFLGKAPVWLFFMITGLLFWQKLIRGHGAMRWRALYVGRVFRIGPLYLAVALTMLLIVFLNTGFRLNGDPAAVLTQVAKWLALGLFGTATTEVNGYAHADTIVAGVTWTLQFEWLFYFFLLLFYPLARARTRLVFPLAVLVVTLAVPSSGAGEFLLACLGSFFAGMSCAALVERGVELKADPRLWSAAALLCLIPGAVGLVEPTGNVQIGLLAIFFFLVCAGSDLFGLLRTRAAVRLGNLSYSVYLTHGLVLTVLFMVPLARDVMVATALGFWLVGTIAVFAVAGLSALTYVFIERPGIQLGRRLTRKAPAQQK